MKNVLKAVFSVALMLLAAPALQAQNLAASNTTAAPSTLDHAATVTFTNAAGNTTAGFDFLMTYDTTRLTILTADITGNIVGAAVNCSVPVAGTIACIVNANAGTLPATGTITLLFDTGATIGMTPLTFGVTNFSDALGNSQAGTTTNGSIDVQVPTGPAPEVDAVPPPGARIINDPVVPAGPTNDVITISNTGTAALTLSVAETGDASGVFTGTLGSGSVAAAGNTTLTVACNAPSAGPFTATYTVTTNDADEPTLVYTYTCNGVVAPEFNAALSLALTGAPGATVAGSITVSNTGSAPLTITCGAPSAGFTVTSAPVSPVAAGGSTTIGISCVAPLAAGATTVGTLACTTNDTDEAAVTFALSCSSQLLSVPTMSLAGKTLLATLLAGLGLLGFALRRKFV